MSLLHRWQSREPWLQRWLPRYPARERPHDTTYGIDDAPPAGMLLVLSLQHLLSAVPSLLFVLVLAEQAGLSATEATSIMAGSLIAMGVGTFLQSWGGRLGSGLLLVQMVDPIPVTLISMAVVLHGRSAVTTATLIAGITAVVVGPILPRLRSWFPPPVVGTAICMAGISILPQSLRNAADLGLGRGINLHSALIATISLATMLGLSIWGGRRASVYAAIGGIGLGSAFAALSGDIGGWERLAQSPWFALPSFSMPSFSLAPGVVFAVILVALLNQLDNIGGAVMMDSMVDARWRRANMRAIVGTLRANGIGDVLGAFFGAAPTLHSSANIALARLTHATSRYIGIATAALMLGLAFLPKVTYAITLVPTSVRGAMGLYASMFLIVAGMEMARSRALDQRGSAVVGIGMCAGLAVMIFPEISVSMPAAWRLLLENAFVASTLVMIILNQIVRIGVTQRATALLRPVADSDERRQVDAFLERWCRLWMVRREVLIQAKNAAIEAAELIREIPGAEMVCIRATFDELNLTLDIEHTGSPIAVPDTRIPEDKLRALMSTEASSENQTQTMRWIGALLLRQLADGVVSEPIPTAPGHSRIRLQIHH